MKLTIIFVLIFSILPICHLIPYKTLISLFRSKISAAIKNNNFEKQCASDLEMLVSGIFDAKFWALKMLDSTGKFYPGLFKGNLHAFGDFDECLSIEEHVNERSIKGQYCTIILTVSKAALSSLNITGLRGGQDTRGIVGGENIRINWGVCLPESCSVKSLQNVTNSAFEALHLPISPHIPDDMCLYKGKETIKYKTVDVFVYFIFLILIITVIGSTIYELSFLQSEKKMNCFIIFSARNNMKRLLTISDDRNMFGALEGMKVISAVWVLVGHLAASSAYMSKNPIYIFSDWKLNIMNNVFWSPQYALPTFFVISSFLMSYNYFETSEKYPVRIVPFYLQRILRLLPTLLVVSLINASVLKLFASGPYGPHTVDFIMGSCYDRWWTFFIFFISFNTCVGISWYITIDTQLYLCSPVILFFIKKHTKQVIAGMVVAFLAGIVYCFTITVKKQLGYTIFEFTTDLETYISNSVLTFVPSWVSGILFGYLLHLKKIKFSKKTNVIFWILSMYGIFGLITHQNTLFTNDYNVYRFAFWNAFAKPTWSLAICFIITSCATGYGGTINSFLSHKIFRILGKLTYSFYIIQNSIILLFFSSYKTSIHFSSFQLVCFIITLTVLVLCVALVIHLCVEAPLLAAKSLYKKNRRSTRGV